MFADGMSLDEKLSAYEATLGERIRMASSEPVAEALTAMRDHTLAAARRLRGGASSCINAQPRRSRAGERRLAALSHHAA